MSASSKSTGGDVPPAKILAKSPDPQEWEPQDVKKFFENNKADYKLNWQAHIDSLYDNGVDGLDAFFTLKRKDSVNSASTLDYGAAVKTEKLIQATQDSFITRLPSSLYTELFSESSIFNSGPSS